MFLLTQMIINTSKKVNAVIEILQSLTGLFLIIFTAIHLLLDSTILISPAVYNSIPLIMEKFYFGAISVTTLVITLILHFIFVWRKIPSKTYEFMSLFKTAFSIKHRDTFLWIVQIFTGMCIIILVTIHVWEIITANILKIHSVSSSARVSIFYYRVFYHLLMSLVLVHMFIGAYKLFVKWSSVSRKSVMAILVVMFMFYFTLSVFTIREFSYRGQIQAKLKKSLMIIAHEKDAVILDIEIAKSVKYLDELKMKLTLDVIDNLEMTEYRKILSEKIK